VSDTRQLLRIDPGAKGRGDEGQGGFMTFSSYEDYLHHPIFRIVRELAMSRNQGLCASCQAPASESTT
jgi:hypothetical protein